MGPFLPLLAVVFEITPLLFVPLFRRQSLHTVNNANGMFVAKPLSVHSTFPSFRAPAPPRRGAPCLVRPAGRMHLEVKLLYGP